MGVWVIVGITGYVACGVLSYGLVFHYYQTRFRFFAWPSRNTYRVVASMAAVCGPMGFLHRLIITVGDEAKVPWRLQYYTVSADESWQAWQRRFPGLSRERWLSV